MYEARLAGSSEVVFDDIGEWSGGLTVRGVDGQTHASSTPTSGPDSESPEVSPSRITKIGNVPIADYEGSPRRYGPRSGNMRFSPRRGHSMRPRPGFPRRVSAYPDDKKNSSEKHELRAENNISKEKWGNGGVSNNVSELEKRESPVPPAISIATLSSVYASTLNDSVNTTSTTASEKAAGAVDPDLIYDYEVSETQKVLQEFFKDSRVSRASPQAFYDLEYHLKRHHGNSYVGQRLAEEYEADFSAHCKDVTKPASVGEMDNIANDACCKSVHVADVGKVGACEGPGDQVVKFDNSEVSNGLPASFHHYPCFSHCHLSHHRLMRPDKQCHMVSCTTPTHLPRELPSLYSSTCHTVPHNLSSSSFVPIDTSSSSCVSSGSFVSNVCGGDSSFVNCDLLKSQTFSEYKPSDSKTIVSLIPSSHICCHDTFSQECCALGDDLLQVTDCREEQSLPPCCDNLPSEVNLVNKDANICDLDTSVEVKASDADANEDLVNLDDLEEELRVTLERGDEESDVECSGLPDLSAVGNLLDLPIDFPLADDSVPLASMCDVSAPPDTFLDDQPSTMTRDEATGGQVKPAKQTESYPTDAGGHQVNGGASSSLSKTSICSLLYFFLVSLEPYHQVNILRSSF